MNLLNFSSVVYELVVKGICRPLDPYQYVVDESYQVAADSPSLNSYPTYFFILFYFILVYCSTTASFCFFVYFNVGLIFLSSLSLILLYFYCL